jgi:hypothetical protein
VHPDPAASSESARTSATYEQPAEPCRHSVTIEPWPERAGFLREVEDAGRQLRTSTRSTGRHDDRLQVPAT